MSERKEYWAKVVNEEALSFLCSIGVCTRELPIMKVYDISYNKVMIVEILRSNIPHLIKYYFSDGDISPLSYEDAVLLNMEYNAKWEEICNDCIVRETTRMCESFTKGIMSKEEAKMLIMDIDVGSKKDNISYQRIKDRQANARQELPDEIDLYNFFEKWGGFAIGRYLSCSDKYVVGRDVTLIGDMRSYMKERDGFDYIIYKIGLQFYHAIKFKDRGTFLVSEKKYKEMKTRKGCTV